MVGTVAYMSPEQVRAKELDAPTDQFSFGAALYEMATGTMPFHGESTGVIFKAILDSVPPPPIRFNRDLPTKLEDIINRALEKDKNLRYQHPPIWGPTWNGSGVIPSPAARVRRWWQAWKRAPMWRLLLPRRPAVLLSYPPRSNTNGG